MGQRHLPKELRTRKINSLPDDLKGIAEELIADKFDIKEEVVERKRSSSFPGFSIKSFGDYTVGIDMGRESVTTVDERFTGTTTATEVVLAATRREPGVDRKVDFYSRSSYFVTPITRADTRAFLDAIQRLDYENAPRHKRRASVPTDFARELIGDVDFRYYAAFRDDRYRGHKYGNYIGDLFGVPIFAVEGVHPEIIAE